MTNPPPEAFNAGAVKVVESNITSELPSIEFASVNIAISPSLPFVASTNVLPQTRESISSVFIVLSASSINTELSSPVDNPFEKFIPGTCTCIGSA